MLNRKHEYAAVAELQNDGKRLLPMLQVSLPGQQPMKMGGNIVHRPGRRLGFDFTLENIMNGKPITVKGQSLLYFIMYKFIEILPYYLVCKAFNFIMNS